MKVVLCTLTQGRENHGKIMENELVVDYLEYLCQTGRIEGNPLLYADEEHPELVDFMENRMVSSFEWKISDAEIYPILWEVLDGEISEDEVIEKLTQNVRMQLNE